MKVTLKNIAGYENEKKEALKIINFLKNYEEYISDGINLPKGLLLTGCPGVGKTLLAKAIANESNANFVEFKNNDEFIVDNIRKTFEKAKQIIPSILFIDELDELVSRSFRNEMSDLQKKTLQVLLTEIDGLESSNGVIVIATCNSKYDIPHALIRSGRLEKQMALNAPSYDARVKIFDLYMSKHKELDGIKRDLLAKMSDGLTGADINNLINEVLLECKTQNIVPSLDDFERYIPVIRYKDIRRKNDDETVNYVAAHEIGHFICTYILKKEIPSISIETYGSVTGYVSRNLDKLEFSKFSKLTEDVTILLGGLAGERVIMDDVTGGSSSDIKKARNKILIMMDMGCFGFEYYLRDEIPYGEPDDTPEYVRELRNKKISSILDECLKNAEELVKSNKYIYDLLIDELLKERRLSIERITEIFKDNNLETY